MLFSKTAGDGAEGARSAWSGHPQFMAAPHPPITRRIMPDVEGVIFKRRLRAAALQ
jgi:hypothetical protein